MKVTKRLKISPELSKMGLKGKLLAIVNQHLDHQSAVALKQQLNKKLNRGERDSIEYWVEYDTKR